MTNTTDLFGPEYHDLALPAAALLVTVNGVLCEDLTTLEIVRRGGPEFGWARLAYHPMSRQDAGVLGIEQSEDRFPMGTSICLHQPYNMTPPDATIAGLPLFVGHVDGLEIALGPEGEHVEVIIRDFSAVLRRITVYGQRVLRSDGSVIFLPGLETVFNPLGQGNAAAPCVTADGKTYRVFSADAARVWSCADVLNYLLSVYVLPGDLSWPGLPQLLALTDGWPVRDLDVTGLNLLEALQRGCAEVGLQFCFVPRLAETGPAQALVFYRNGRGRTVELNHQPPGERVSPARTNIAALQGRREFYPVTHRYIGQGDFKVYEATMELVQAWDPALEDADYEKFSASTNPAFPQVRDVYRKWCLNEAGDYTGAPYLRGAPYDFAGIFGQAAYVQRRRRFWPALSTDAQGRSLGYFLQVSLDDGLHWEPYLSAFDNLPDECGVWLSSDPFDADIWVAAQQGVLRSRMTAAVVSDERLTCIVADGPVGSTIPVVDRVLTLAGQFRYRQVSSRSVLAGPSGAGFGRPEEVDDSAVLHQFVRQRAAVAPALIEAAQVQTSSLMLHFQPGDRVTVSPDSRDLLSARRDNRSMVWIDRIHMDFRNQCTNLQVIRQRVYEG